MNCKTHQTHSILSWKTFLTLCVAALSVQGVARATTNSTPAVSITSPVFTGARGLYDFTGVFSNFTASYYAGQSNGQTNIVDVNEAFNIVQSIAGVLTPTGTATTLTVMPSDTESFSFPGTYTLKGAIKSAGNNLSVAFTLTGKGSVADTNNVTTRYTQSVTIQVLVTPTGFMTGKQTGTASRSGPGGGTVKIVDSQIQNRPFPFSPLDWSLSLSGLTTTGTKITGGQALVNVVNGRSFPFTVKGTIKNGVSQLTLTGAGTGANSAKGAKLAVTLTGSTITGITGSLLGQKINLSGL